MRPCDSFSSWWLTETAKEILRSPSTKVVLATISAVRVCREKSRILPWSIKFMAQMRRQTLLRICLERVSFVENDAKNRKRSPSTRICAHVISLPCSGTHGHCCSTHLWTIKPSNPMASCSSLGDCRQLCYPSLLASSQERTGARALKPSASSIPARLGLQSVAHARTNCRRYSACLPAFCKRLAEVRWQHGLRSTIAGASRWWQWRRKSSIGCHPGFRGSDKHCLASDRVACEICVPSDHYTSLLWIQEPSLRLILIYGVIWLYPLSWVHSSPVAGRDAGTRQVAELEQGIVKTS